jgi:sugar lactone lactonase YvrE
VSGAEPLPLGQARLVWAAGAELGEGATWDAHAARLWWVDIRGRRLHRMDEAGGDRRCWELPQEPGCVALTDDPARVVLGLRTGVFLFEPGPAGSNPVAVPEGHAPGHRLNDGKVDPSGRFWFGTMHDEERPAEGALHLLERPRARRRRAPTGPTRSRTARPSPRTGASCTAPTARRRRLRLRRDDGRPARKREFVRFAEGEGHPDGMTVDAEACLWVAHWGGGRVSRFAPDGRRLGRIGVPTERVTSCAFGGADLRTLFITSAGGTGSAECGLAGRWSSAARTEAAGLPPGRIRLGEWDPDRAPTVTPDGAADAAPEASGTGAAAGR